MKTHNCHKCGKIITEGYCLGSDIFCTKECMLIFTEESMESKNKISVEQAIEENIIIGF